MGTSHQLLSFYLRLWDKWQEKEYRRKANNIRARAESENRPLTQWEQSQADAYQREAFQAMLTRVLDSGLKKMLMRLMTGDVLSKPELPFVNQAARKGFPVFAQGSWEKRVAKIDRKIKKIICHCDILVLLSPLDEHEAGWLFSQNAGSHTVCKKRD